MRQGIPFLERRKGSRLLLVGLAVAFAASLVGFLVGTSAEPRIVLPPEPEHRTPSSEAQPAVNYTEMAMASQGPNKDRPREIRSQAPPTPTPPVYETADQLIALKHEALSARGALRAFNGAPPVIPHTVDQRDARACMACHRDGLVMGDQIAPRMSHVYLTNCTQCHASSLVSPFLEAPQLAENTFDGVPAPLEGDRAWMGAPPVIPHTTQMRSDCLSCHGPAGLEGLRTSHPERQSCLQCHAPSAKLDQVPFSFASFSDWRQ